MFLMSFDGHCAAWSSSKTRAFPNAQKNEVKWGRRLRELTPPKRKGVARAASVVGGIQSLTANKRRRTRGPALPLSLCVDGVCQTPWSRRRFLQQTPAAPFGSLSFIFFVFVSYAKPFSNPPHPRPPLLLLVSQGCKPRLSSRLCGEGTSLLAGMDILTGDILWPLAYGNSVKAQPGLIVTSAVLGEVFGEVQA